MIEDEAHARWRIVAPFCKPLLGWFALDTHARVGTVQSHCAGVVLTMRMLSGPDVQRSLRDALELLHTLWRLDPREWGLALELGARQRLNGARVVHDDGKTAPHVVLCFKHDKFPFQLRRERWRDLLYSVTMSDEAAQAKQQLLEKYEVASLATDSVDVATIALRLEFLVFGMATADVDAYIAQIVIVVEEIQASLRLHHVNEAASVAQGRLYTPFELVSVDLELSSILMTPSIASHINRLHALGVPLRLLRMRMMTADYSDEMPREVCDRLFATVMQPVSTTTPAVETLALDRADRVAFASMCSVLAQPTQVKQLQMYSVFTFDSDADRQSKWRSLAIALFSRWSATSVRQLALTEFELQLADIETIADVVSAPESLPRQSAAPLMNGGLETLALSCEASTEATLTAIPMLVGHVGPNLHTLSVHLWAGRQTTEMVRGYLRACRHLHVLDLYSVDLDSMDVFTEAYERGDCRIKALALQDCRVSSASLSHFIETLRDSTTKLAGVLRELRLNRCGADNALDAQHLQALVGTLKANRTLTFLDVRVEEPLLSAFRDRLLAHNHESIPVRAAPLAMYRKVAFLSAVRRRNTAGQDWRQSRDVRVMEALDGNVLSLIFAFAATRRCRSVTVEDT